MRDFWGGVYKTFAVQGPGVFYLRVARQGSHNAIVSGVMADRMPEEREDPQKPRGSTIMFFGRVVYAPPDAQTVTPEGTPALAGVLSLWDAAQDACAYSGGVEWFTVARHLAYRAALDRRAPEELIHNWRWHLSAWDDAEHRNFYDTMMRAWTAQQERQIFYRSAESYPYSPNVVPFSTEKLKEMAAQGVDWHQFIAKGKNSRKEK